MILRRAVAVEVIESARRGRNSTKVPVFRQCGFLGSYLGRLVPGDSRLRPFGLHEKGPVGSALKLCASEIVRR